MSINYYVNIEASVDFQSFEFESIGKEVHKKKVRLDIIDEEEQLYNLALGTVMQDNQIDWTSASKNGDMDIVLQTAAYIGVIFTNKFPERKILFAGSDPVRTRKYQIGISNQIDKVMEQFIVEGAMIENKKIVRRELFKKGINYSALIFTRKK